MPEKVCATGKTAICVAYEWNTNGSKCKTYHTSGPAIKGTASAGSDSH